MAIARAAHPTISETLIRPVWSWLTQHAARQERPWSVGFLQGVWQQALAESQPMTLHAAVMLAAQVCEVRRG